MATIVETIVTITIIRRIKLSVDESKGSKYLVKRILLRLHPIQINIKVALQIHRFTSLQESFIINVQKGTSLKILKRR